MHPQSLTPEMRKEIDSMIKKGIEEGLKSAQDDMLFRISRDSQLIAVVSVIVAMGSMWFATYEPLKEILPNFNPQLYLISTVVVLLIILVFMFLCWILKKRY